MTDSSDDETRAPSETSETSDEPTPAAGFRVSSAVLVMPADGARYAKGEEIARGGLGTIATATDRKLQRRVAIKELHVSSGRTEAAKARFVREGLVIANLQHPAIVPILDAGTWETSGDPFLVMKLLEGKTLAEELAARTTAEARLALVPNLLAIADALGYAHERGIVHRDVKPANIMIGMHGETVLLDWGLAFDTADTATRVEIAGTPRFMSPEHAAGDRPTPAFDVFSLGVTLAHLIGEDADRAPDLAAIAAKAQAPSPAARYVDGAALAADLRKLLAGQLVGARRYTRAQLLARWIRRNKVAVAIGAAAAIALGVLGAIAVRSVLDERDAANARRAEAEARAQDLVLAQARANLRSDPTATVAWLAQYPIDAPHQDEVLALVDEAAGRGVARHVWRPAATPSDAAWTPDGHAIVTVYATGELWRDDVTTGAHERLAAIDRPLDSVLARGDAIFALDRDGGIWRWGANPRAFGRYAQVPISSRTSGLYLAGAELKVTYQDDIGMYVNADVADTPHPRPQVPAAFDFAFSDDENDATSLYAVSPAGDLALVDPASTTAGFVPLAKFAPHSWVRSSTNGKRYAAVVPGATDVAIYAGTDDPRQPPVQIATSRRCATGEDLEEDADVGDDGRFIAVRRCGELAIYDVPGKRRVPFAQPERIEYFELANAGGWITIGRDGGLQLVDLESGESRLLAGGDVDFSKYAPARDLVVSVGAAQGVRAWPMAHTPAIVLGDVAAPARLQLARGTGDLAVARHLECELWRPSDRVRLAHFGTTDTRGPDDDDARWPWDIAGDGRACVFAMPHGDAAIVRPDASRTILAAAGDDALLQCILVGDGGAICRTEKHALRTFDASGREVGAPRPALGVVRALVRSGDRALVVVERPGACAIETPAGEAVAALPAGCRDARATGPGIAITRTNAVDVWTPAHGVTSVPLDGGIAPNLVEIAPDQARVAMVHKGTTDVWDLATKQPSIDPPKHARAITSLAWSATGVLATVDAETVHLWDVRSGVARVVFAEHVRALAWSADGATLYTTDGLDVRAQPIDLARGATPREVRARIEALTSAHIVDGKPTTR